MCGIAGIVKGHGAPLQVDHLRMLLIGLESRGHDAAGVALQAADGGTQVYKAAVSGSTLAGDAAFLAWAEERAPKAVAALVHTRAWTKGPPSVAENNHPLYGTHVAVVHNGMISNDDALFKQFGWPRQGTVDSDIIRAAVEAYGLTREAVQALEKLEGSAAILALDARMPGAMMVLRDTSPLHYALVKGQFWLASTPEVLTKAATEWFQAYGKWWPRSVRESEPVAWGEQAALIRQEGLTWEQPWSLPVRTDPRAMRVWRGHSRRGDSWRGDYAV